MNSNLVPSGDLTDWHLIDEGHFGSVYKARHTRYNVQVAVKKLKGDVLQSVREITSEAEKMASALASPFVIRLYGIIEENAHGPPGIVMEYMEYGSVWTLMEKVRTIPWALKFRIIHEVTVGMNWLHHLSTPILHLDLKTKNVLLDAELHIKITDFGLSKYTSGSSIHGPEDCEGVGGTLEYMPPESFQEGYLPSTSTDVYSFAILSVVVLRGQNPYPVDESVLIRTLVPRGQRPCVLELEKETSVKHLKEAIDFTKHCWDNDKFKRPPFNECCIEWEKFFTAHKCDIKQAVRNVQDKMDSSEPNQKTTNVPYNGDTSINTRNMSEVIHKFRTMNVSEGPPVLLASAPVMGSQNMPTSGYPAALPQRHLQRAVGSNYRPRSTYYPEHEYLLSSPNRQHSRVHPSTLPQDHSRATMGANYRPQHPYYPGHIPFGYQPSPRYVQPPPDLRQSFQSNPATTVHITNSSNFQIGDNTIMNVTNKSHPGLYQNMVYRQPVHTTGSRYPSPMSPQPKQTTQGYYNVPSRQAASDQPCKQETVVKSDQQSQIRPRTTPEGLSTSNAYDILTQRRMPTTEKPTTKYPGQ